MFERLQKFLDRFESRYSLWILIQGSSVLSTGAVTGWLSSTSEVISSYGAFGWWTASMLGALVTTIILVCFAWFRYKWACASAVNHWKKTTSRDVINPLESEFHKKRINISDLVSPITRGISSKKFVDCELVGPANIFLRSGSMVNTTYVNCDFVVVVDGLKFFNVICVDNTSIIGGSIYMATIMLLKEEVRTYHSMGIRFGTLTGVPEIDNPVHPSTEAGTQP